ncbi:scavenger receptor cysteine-rich type 1 protein M160-like [Cheilinus undulatus]|uniref:scavenger receptor cysteine-rich type 1 protein M160-like n=1 Tax=Cheilinus undulatus TaxID=241271 RepID=UPI001BD5248C|nr:scavenger receptor cysteine-rich type 1 protein M160-like [Cheilinus undulatus]
MDDRVLIVFLWLWSSAVPDEVRLVGGASRCAGILERRDGGDWRAVNVSLSEWNLTSAETLCRQLDCGSVLSLGRPENSSRTEPPSYSRNLQINCSDPDDDVRLVRGSSTCSGRLEMKHHGEWRPADPSFYKWTLKFPAVICRRLNCGSAVSSRLIEESSDRPVWMIIPGCAESKSTLKECVDTVDGSRSYGLEITCSDSVRLVNGTGLCSGRLEVKSDQRWSPVCEEDLDLQGAKVVCRELGCGAPSVLKGGMFGEVEAPFWTKKFQCEGHESALLDCPDSGLTGNTCPPATAIGITCSDPDDDFRLVGGSSTCSGRLEWKRHGEWRPGHPSYFFPSLNETAGICRRLDCGSVVSSIHREKSSDRPVWRISPFCVQSKSTLKECVETVDWSRSYGLEITCSDSVRLVNGTGLCSGRLEVKSDQRWSPVCEEDLDLQGAQVVCRELSCGAPSVFKGGMFGEVEAPFWTKKFQCEGHESALLDCPDSGLTGNTCPPATAVGITCSDPDDFRLAGGSSTCSGRLEMKHHGEWRPADPFQSSWTLKFPAVICRRLDCGSVVSARHIEESSDRPVWMINPYCEESKSTLKECVDTVDWSSFDVLEITCSDSVRLVNGTGLCSGKLEVKSDQRWSPVCEEDLDLQGAQVVCRELGCGAPSVFKGGMFGEVEAPFWTKKFQCEGHESALLDCPDSGLTGNTCPPATAVGITCSDPDDVRLARGSSTCSGRLEWKRHGEWRPVDPSYSSLNLKDAAGICRRLDCGSAVLYREIKESSDRPVWSIITDCVPFKSTLKECVIPLDLSSSYGLEITCSDSVRLVNGTDLCSGRLEVKSDQRWSPVCEEDLDLQGAQVVCRELGCGAPSVFKGGMLGEVEAPFWTRDFQCKGNESALLDCGGFDSGRTTCSPGKAVGLSCENPHIRLVGEPSRCAGTLEMKHMEEWKPLDDWESLWDQRSAAAACRILKCGSAVSTRRVEHKNKRPVWVIRPSCVQTFSLLECVHYGSYGSDSDIEVICSDLLEKPNITFSFSTNGASEATLQGYRALIGSSFNITCSIKPQYEGGDFQLIYSDAVTTQSYSQTAVNHSAHFLFPPANQSHRGQYSCVYHLHVYSHNFSSESQTLSLAVGDPLRDLIIRCVVLLGGLLIYDTALYCYYKVKTRQIPRDY